MVDEDKIDQTIMMCYLNAFSRKISSTWINPAKSRMVEDLSRVFFKDESPEGLYPACVVTEDLLGQIVVIIPALKFKELLEVQRTLGIMEKTASRESRSCQEND